MAITGIVALLSFACCIGFALFQNFALAEDTLQEMVGVWRHGMRSEKCFTMTTAVRN